MDRSALAAALVLAAGCASTPEAAPPLPAAYSVEVRFVRTDGETVLAPRLLVFAGQRSKVQVMRPVSYIQSFELGRKEGSLVADPIIGTVSGGILLEATTTPVADGSGARFEYSITVMEPGKVLPERTIPLGEGVPMTLQMPEVEKVSVAGAALLPDGEERAGAVRPWPGEEGRGVTVWVRARGTGFPEAMEILEGEEMELVGGGGPSKEDLAAAPRPAPVAAAVVGAPGWFRLRSVRLAGAMEQGTVVEGDALRALLEGGTVTVERDLRWAGSGDAPRSVSVVVERPFLTDFDIEEGNDTHVTGPVLQNLSFGILADPDAAGGYRCTLSSILPVKTFTTSLGVGDFPPVTIDLPEIHVRAGNLPGGPGERLLVLGPRDGGGTDAVILSFDPE